MRFVVVSGLLMLTATPAAAQVPYGRTPPNSQQSVQAPQGVDKNTLYTDVEYISGHEGFSEKKKGQLVVTADGVGFFDNKGEPVFSLTARAIKNAEHTRDIRGASVGKKLLFGALAGDRKQDFLTITIETESTAEGVVFKVKQNAATGIAAKIGFYARKARGEAPATESDSPAVATAELEPAPTSDPAGPTTSPAGPSDRANPASGPQSPPYRSNTDLSADVGFRLAVGDAQRLGIVTEYREIASETLAVDLSDQAMAEANTERHLERIYSAYRRLCSSSPTTTLLLRHKGLSVGEYTSAGLAKGDWRW